MTMQLKVHALLTICMAIAVLSTSHYLLNSVSNGVANVRIELRIENTERFDFKKIQLYAKYRAPGSLESSEWQLMHPDISGTISLTVPDKSKVFVEIKSLDGSLKLPSGIFYSFPEGGSKTVLLDEFEIHDSSLLKTYVLQSGIPVTVCPSNFTLSGHVEFSPPNDKADREVSVFSFSEIPRGTRYVLGGLQPQIWKFSLVDDRDKTLKSKTIDLSDSNSFQLFCGSTA